MREQTVLPDSSEIEAALGEREARQVIWQPTIVIGIGGTGKEVVLEIKQQLERLPEVPPVLAFLVIDTDPEKHEGLEAREWIHTQVNGTVVVKNLSMYPSIEEWWVRGIKAGRIAKGARQRRYLGRLSLFYPENLGEVTAGIQTALSDVMGVDKTKYHNVVDTSHVVVNVVGSLCGGTGAGMFLDLAYLCRYLIGEGEGYDLSLIGTFGMPSMFTAITLKALPNQYKRIRANCYAALKALESFTGRARWRVNYPTLGEIDIAATPYDVFYLVGGTNEAGRQFAEQEEAYRMMAERILAESTSSVGNRFQSMFVNLDTLAEEIPVERYEKPTALSSFAVSSLVVPRRNIRDYCSFQLAKEVIDLGLLKSRDDTEVEEMISTFTASHPIDWNRLRQEIREENQAVRSQLTALTCTRDDLVEDVDTGNIPQRVRGQLDLLDTENSEDKLALGQRIKSAIGALGVARQQQLRDGLEFIVRNHGVGAAHTFLRLTREDLVDFKNALAGDEYFKQIRAASEECKADIDDMMTIAKKTFVRSKREKVQREVGEFVENYHRLLNANFDYYTQEHLNRSFYTPLIALIDNAMPEFDKCVKSLHQIEMMLRSAAKVVLGEVEAEAEEYSLDRSVLSASDIEAIYSAEVGDIGPRVTEFLQQFGLPIFWDAETGGCIGWHTENLREVANSRFLAYCTDFANTTCAKHDIFSVLSRNPDQIGGKIEWLLDVSRPFCQYVDGLRGEADFEEMHIVAVPQNAYNAEEFQSIQNTIEQKSQIKDMYRIVLTPNADRITVVSYRHGHALFSLVDVRRHQTFYERFDPKALHISKDWLDLETLVPKTEAPEYGEEAVLAWALGRTLSLEGVKDKRGKPVKPIHWIGANVYWFRYGAASIGERSEKLGNDFISAYETFLDTEEAVENVEAYIEHLEEKEGDAKMLEVVENRVGELEKEWTTRQEGERKTILSKEIDTLNQYAHRLRDALSV